MQPVIEQIKMAMVGTLVLITAGFALYTGGSGPFEAPLQRGLFLLFMMPLIFLMIPSGFRLGDTLEAILGIVLTLVSVAVFTWNVLNFARLYSDPFLDPLDIWLGAAGMILVLEAVRRTVGIIITLFIVAFIVFAYFGPSIPVSQLRHGGLDVETMVSMIFYGTDGVFGTPVGVCATFVVMVIMLGSILTAAGGIELFMNLAKSVAGRLTGGPAKIAVVGSAMMGMVTGATVANVATTGAMTIPMMKRAGYDKHFAGAVEALASSGGQLMPPIMGAAAFVMIEYLNIGYLQLVGYAITPALLYFVAVLTIVHMRSVKIGLGGVSTDQLPSFLEEMKLRGHMLLPIVLLVGLMSQRLSLMYAAFFAVVAAMLLALVRPESRLTLRGYYYGFENAMKAMAPLTAICAGAGILIGVLTSTGLNLKITFLIEYVAQGDLFITLLLTMVACIVLGMGLPTVAAYVVLATLVPSALINLGVPPVAAHLFIFYFAILSAITPPVCTGAYVAAGIANANPLKTGLVAIKLGLVVFMIPYAFVYNPSLLMIGTTGAIVIHIITAVLGISLWAFGLEGYFKRSLRAVTRGAFILAGVLLIWPIPWVSFTGFALAAPFLVWETVGKGRRNAEAELRERSFGSASVPPPDG